MSQASSNPGIPPVAGKGRIDKVDDKAYDKVWGRGSDKAYDNVYDKVCTQGTIDKVLDEARSALPQASRLETAAIASDPLMVESSA